MANIFKERRKSLLGSTGIPFGSLIYASACINCPSALGDATVVSASIAVSNVTDGDFCQVQVNTNAPSAMILTGACAVTGGISASWLNSASTDNAASADVTVSYPVLT